MRITNVLLCTVVVLLCVAGSTGAATIGSLSDDFTAPAIDAAKWTSMAADFEVGTGTYTADTSTNPGQLTIAGVNDGTSYWGGQVLQSVGTFDSSKPAAISVDRISLAGSGTARRSSLWIKQTDGTYLHFAQNVGENGWQYNPNNTGGGSNIGSLDGLDGSTGLHEMTIGYIPLGGNNARIEMYLDDVQHAVHTFSGDWENGTDFYVRLSGMARQAPADTVIAVFDDFSAQSVDVSVNQTDLNTSTGFTVSNSDLLEGLVPNVTGNINAEEGQTTSDPAALTNGAFGDPGLPGGANVNEVVAIHNDTTLEYQLDTATFPLGFDITSIATYTGWRDGGRDAQDYTVFYSTVDNPALFLPYHLVNYNPGGAPSPSDTAVSLDEASGGLLASGVSSIRFAFDTTENGFVGFRELDVFGRPTQTAGEIPEPATMCLLGMAVAGLGGYLRRRRQA